MRIGIFANMTSGLEHFVYRELRFLSKADCDISLFPTRFHPGLYNPLAHWRVYPWHPVTVILLQPFFFLLRPIRYVCLLWEAIRYGTLVDFALGWYFSRFLNDVDVLYATFGDHKLFIGYFCKQIQQKPLAVTIHAYELYQNPHPAFFCRVLDSCDQIITVTEYNREYLQAHYGIDPEKVTVVRYSVDTDEYRPAKKFVILIVAFFVERKGHEVLFKAIKQLGRQDIEVWVVGGEGGEATVDVQAMATAFGVDSQVVFLGKLGGTALQAMYHACDVFCLPCRADSHGVSEGFPNVLIEAMAFGKPVITTRHVEIPRVIPEILVDENDVQGLAQAIERVYQSVELRQRLGTQNRALAEKFFSPHNAAQTHAILQGLAHKHRAILAGEPDTSGKMMLLVHTPERADVAETPGSTSP